MYVVLKAVEEEENQRLIRLKPILNDSIKLVINHEDVNEKPNYPLIQNSEKNTSIRIKSIYFVKFILALI